jgi:hypothetical protein
MALSRMGRLVPVDDFFYAQIKRRTLVVRIFPHAAACLRLVRDDLRNTFYRWYPGVNTSSGAQARAAQPPLCLGLFLLGYRSQLPGAAACVL